MGRAQKEQHKMDTATAKVPLPKGWKYFRFDEIAINITDRVDDPSQAGVEHYVGLEHLDPDSLKIRRWGTPEEVEATKLRFRAGDIIFGRRRAYQRKLGVAEFEGICSAHALVLRANAKNIVPTLLPIFMQTDTFMNRAVAISKGSLSPTINWPDLARQEFALPVDLAEQRRIVEVVRAADVTIYLWQDSEQKLSEFLTTFSETFLLDHRQIPQAKLASSPLGVIPKQWRSVACENLFIDSPRNGLSPQANASEEGYPTLSLGSVKNGQIVPDGNIKYVALDPETAAAYSLSAGDLLVVRGNGNKSLVARCGLVGMVPDGCIYPDLLIRLKFDASLIRPRFAWIQWNTPSVHNRLCRSAKSTNGIWKINGSDINRHLFLVPPLHEQDLFLQTWNAISERRKLMEQQIARSKAVRDCLRVAIFDCAPKG